jgi:hypothetical protein
MTSPENREPDSADQDAAGQEPVDQDAEPTMTAPPGERPDAGASALDPDGRADDPDALDADAGTE